ncbi:nuclear mitotic apparatus protein 1-like isoform X2 [Anopheles funestus]|uniref:nuclear mitotic apparatus protein 1-like isoform X2 n=1 Tax=Anopheles funestus TaxID=62324 RepID=UPI0020C7378D|nr:nuclear mitotic apparatus protein 1-like isoform X2 [Anopheles funestus]
MADKNKEEPYWSRIVLRWVKCAQLNAGHDNIDLAACYYNFRCKIKDYYDLQEKTIVEFLRVKFPDFELQLGKENEVPASDAIYVFSLMLYFSCVRHSIPYFQNIGKEFDVAYQHSMKAFLNSFVSENDNKIVINRSFMHKAFQNAKRSATVLSEDSCNRRDHSQHGVQMLTSTPIGKLEMKKPSPPTPKSVALEWKVKNLNAMLESARSENITQERQIEQLLQNVKDLQEDKKRYRTKISVLQLKEMCSCTSDSAELPHTINRETEQLQKQLDMNNKLIETLQENISKAKESAKTATERYMAMQKQYAAVQEDNVRMKITIEDLKEELTLRDNMNQNLTEAVNDLRRFIRENHIRGAELMEPLNSSFEYLDKSFKNVTSDDSQCYDSENLASTVVDIKLKEKEHENEALTMKIQELEGNLQDMQRLQKEMLEQHTDRQTEANAKIADLLRSLAESEEHKKQLTHDHDKLNKEMEILICQLKSQKQSHFEERERLQAEMNEKIAEFQISSAEARQIQMKLADEIKQKQAEIQDLNRKFDIQLNLQAEMDEKTAEMRQALADAEKDKSQLTEDLKKGKAESEELICQLESLKKLQMEERLRLEDEMNKKTAEMQQALADAEKDKSQLTEDLKKGKAESEELVCQLKSLKKLQMEERLRFEAEINKKTAEMQQALADAENDKSQLAEDLKKGKAESEELVCQLGSLKKLQMEERLRFEAEMNKKTAEMQQALADAENDKSQLAEDLKKGKAESEELVCQLESLKKLQLEERLRLEAEVNKKTAEMQQALADAENDKSQFAEDLKKGKAESEELVCQLESLKKLQMEERLRLEAEVNKKTAEMQQALADAEKDKSQLAEDLKKGKAESEELVCQLESLKKLQLEERVLLKAAVNKKTAEMQQALADAENDKSQLAEDLKKGKAESEELVCQLESLKKLQMEERLRFEAEVNKNTAEMQQALADAEKDKSQLAEDLKKGKAESEELVCQLESQHKLQMEERLRFEAAMNEQISEMRQALADAEKDKSQLEIYLQNDKSKREELTCQLMIQKQIHIQECECLRSEMNGKNVELQRCLAEAEQMKQNLFDELKAEQAKTQDLNRKLDIQLNLQAEMDEKTSKMRQALADAEKDKSQLAEDLKKGKAESEDLVCQLESLKKLQLEERLRFEAEVNKNTAEMQQALADAAKDKSQLADELNRLKSNESFTTALRTEMLEKVSTLQQSLEQEREKSEEINCQYLQAKKQADDLDAQCIKLMQKLSEDRTDISNLQSELTSKDAKLEELKALYDEKQKQFEKNYQDNEILSVKLYKARSALKEKEDAWAKSMQDCKKDMEEKLRDARIEFDSTMEKMKDRMKELHKEVKTKLACDNQGLALTADGYRRKVENLEIRCAKLQKQLAEMNERNLDVRKENQHLHIKLKTLEEYGHDRKSLMLPTQASLRSNLRMEDEEGELFNNMYLADLKSGRCVSPGPTNGGLDRYSELSQRNSKLLPHLRTNYVALAPDCEPPHDDTRDNMSTTFDDSSTGLISRRKVSGITSYKRPGPPTPSKRAGRLSLNGALAMDNGGEIQYKDALRDANTDAAMGGGGGVGTVAETTGTTRLGRTKTPGKFKQMISSSSLLNNFQRDEGYTAATLKASTRRVHNAANDYPPDMPSNGAIRLSAVAKRKCLQRKILFDSNRGLANGSTHCSQDSAANEASLPLRTILEYPTPKETSLEKGNACGNASPFDALQSIAPMTPVTTAILPVTRTNTTLTDVTTVTTTTTTLATATNGHPVPHLAASDYSFTQPYGSNRYNILRMQLQRREKRRLLYDETRKVPAKGRNVLSSVSFGSPSVSVTARDVDNNNDMDSTGDITLYHSFTSDMDDSNKPTLNTACPNSTTADCTRTPLLLIILAYIGFLAQILFCFGNRPNSSRNR